MSPIRDEWTSPDGAVRLLLGDCLQILPTLEPGSVDAVITSPPYNLGGRPWDKLGHWTEGCSASGGRCGDSFWKNAPDARNGVRYGTHEDAMPWPEYVEWQKAIITACWDILPGDGAIFYNHKPRVIGTKLWTPMELVPPNVILRQIITWARPGGVNYTVTAFVPACEWILVLARDLFRLKSQSASGATDVWRMSPDEVDHPAPFPIELPLRVIDSIKARTVLDPFVGSGTAAAACIRRRKRCIGIEIDPVHFDTAVLRCQAELDRHPLLDAPARRTQRRLL